MGRPGTYKGGGETSPQMAAVRRRVLDATKAAGVKFLNACNENNVIDQLKDGVMICTGVIHRPRTRGAPLPSAPIPGDRQASRLAMKEERARHIGIVAVSAEGAVLRYCTICMEGATVLGPHDHPQVTMHTYSLAEYMRLVETEGWHEAGLLMLESAALLERAGAELLVCPDNTIHQALDLVRERLTLPWIHIAEEVAAVAASRAFKRLGLLGTRYLMEGPVYPQKLLVAADRLRDTRGPRSGADQS